MNVDWGNAPEGATHWDPVDKNWLRQFSGTCLTWLNGSGWSIKGWQYPHILSEMERLIQRPPQQPWCGGDTPPVGTICERNIEGDRWVRTKVIAHYELGCVVAYQDIESPYSLGWCKRASDFRPIRTPEQIAEDEKWKTVDEMLAILKIDEKDPEFRYICAALYCAGYRKQVTP